MSALLLQRSLNVTTTDTSRTRTFYPFCVFFFGILFFCHLCGYSYWRYESHEMSLFFQNICKAHNGNLVKIENAIENWFLKSVAKGKIKKSYQ
jgi:hypothetical protein